MWRYAMWFIIIGLMTMVLLGWCVFYWRSRRDVLEDQEFEKYVMEQEEKNRKDSNES